jgi:hypothetical protein
MFVWMDVGGFRVVPLFMALVGEKTPVIPEFFVEKCPESST